MVTVWLVPGVSVNDEGLTVKNDPFGTTLTVATSLPPLATRKSSVWAGPPETCVIPCGKRLIPTCGAAEPTAVTRVARTASLSDFGSMTEEEHTLRMGQWDRWDEWDLWDL